MKETKVFQDKQNRESKEWHLLQEYIDEIAQNNSEIFNPGKDIGSEFFKKITVLPSSIKKLTKVKSMILYGSSLERIPPEIEFMESLEEFTPYTSYRLRWFPFEILKCKKLRSSTISTRALFGNYKNRKPFPDLNNQRVTYIESKIKCGICDKIEANDLFEQYWITLKVATDTVPLLISVCSENCFKQIPKLVSQANYIEYPHKGGLN